MAPAIGENSMGGPGGGLGGSVFLAVAIDPLATSAANAISIAITMRTLAVNQPPSRRLRLPDVMCTLKR